MSKRIAIVCSGSPEGNNLLNYEPSVRAPWFECHLPLRYLLRYEVPQDAILNTGVVRKAKGCTLHHRVIPISSITVVETWECETFWCDPAPLERGHFCILENRYEYISGSPARCMISAHRILQVFRRSLRAFSVTLLPVGGDVNDNIRGSIVDSLWHVKTVEGCTSFAYGRVDHFAVLNGGCTSDGGDIVDDHVRMAWVLHLMSQVCTVGYAFVVVLKCFLYFAQRMLLLSFDKQPRHTINELVWQYVRLLFWSATTIVCLSHGTTARGRRLNTVQRRRYSVPIRPSWKGTKWQNYFLVFLIVNGHVVDAVNKCQLHTDDLQHLGGFAAGVSSAEATADWSVETILTNDSGALKTHQDQGGQHDFSAQHLASPPCNEPRKSQRNRIAVYGHHGTLGALGVRIGKAENGNLRRVACTLWSDLLGSNCESVLTKPQPEEDGDGVRATLIATQGASHGGHTALLADIDLHGGLPRRHTVPIDEIRSFEKLISFVDRDRTCWQEEKWICVVIHGAKTYFDFDDFFLVHGDYVKITALSDPFREDWGDFLTLQQLKSVTTYDRPGPQLWRFGQDDLVETCFQDEVEFPFPEDENEILFLPPQHMWVGFQGVLEALQQVVAQGKPFVVLDTYGLYREYIGNRMTRLYEITYNGVLQAVSQLWYEYAAGSHMFVYTASPQPENVPPGTTVLIVDFPLDDRDHTFYKAVLVDTVVDGSIQERRTGYVARNSRVSDFAHLAGREGECWPSGLEECHVFPWPPTIQPSVTDSCCGRRLFPLQDLHLHVAIRTTAQCLSTSQIFCTRFPMADEILWYP